jgi:hypothetical protein
MILDLKPLDTIREEDLYLLISDGIIEGKTIEYKRDSYGNTDDSKKEFLKDVSSFANTSGGFLLIGVDAKNGIPAEIPGIEIASIDQEKLRLESILIDNIRPRIQGLKIKEVNLESRSRYVIIISIPQSFVFPHMVTYKKSNKFYSRNSSGSYLLDVEELRNLFGLSGSLVEQARTFRLERLNKIISGETPIPIGTFPKAILHLVPLNPVLSSLQQLSLNPGFIGRRYPDFGPDLRNANSNFDGYVEYNQDFQSQPSYLQVFRTGNMEYVWTRQFMINSDKKLIADIALEKIFLSAVRRLLLIQEFYMNVHPPIFAILSLVGVQGYTVMEYSAKYNNIRIDRDTLLCPEVMLETFNCNIEKEMKIILDVLWNSVGWPECSHYDPSGTNWKGQPLVPQSSLY